MSDYVHMWTEENYHYFETAAILRVYGEKAQKLFGYGILEGATIGKDFHVELYLSEKELERNRTEGMNFFSKPKNFQFLLKKMASTRAAMTQKINDLISQDLTKQDNPSLWNLFDEYGATLAALYTCYSMTQPHKFSLVEETIENLLRQDGVDDVANAISVLVTPESQIRLTKDNPLQKPFSETIQSETAAVDRTLFRHSLFTERKNDETRRNALLKKLAHAKEIDYLTHVLRVLGNERLKMRLVWMTAIYYNELFLIEIKRRYKIPKWEIRHYDYAELESLVKTGKKLAPQKVLDREMGIVKELSNGKIRTLEGKKAQAFIEKISGATNHTELFGTIACKGHAVGQVVIFSYKKTHDHSERVRQMKQGDIVVTEMTRPNIITACQKAGAIVTDEGGLLCHAAIVSRELNIPCVIGTRHATKILKDGDWVKVDADKGIVQKIKKP